MNNGTSLAITISAAKGDTIVVYFSCTTGAAGVSSISDGSSPPNVYVQGPVQNTNVRNEIWYCLNAPNAPTTTLTVNYATATEAAAVVETYTGVIGVGATGSGSGSSTAPAVTVVTTQPNSWVVMCVGGTVSSAWSATGPNEFWHAITSAATGGPIRTGSFDGGNVSSTGSDTVTGTFGTTCTWGTVGLELLSLDFEDDSLPPARPAPADPIVSVW